MCSCRSTRELNSFFESFRWNPQGDRSWQNGLTTGGTMVVTQELFAAYLNCPTKAYLMHSAIPTEQTKFGRWKADIQNKLRQQGVELLRKQSRLEIKESPTADDLSAKRSALYVNCSIGFEELRSLIDAVEKIELRGRKSQLLPCRCQLDKRAERHEKLLLAYDALCLQAFTGVPIRVGKLVDGVSKRAKKFQLNSPLKAVQEHMRRLTELLTQEKEPPLILNRHCVECEFRARCREKATETDDLSLLSKIALKSDKSYKAKESSQSSNFPTCLGHGDDAKAPVQVQTISPMP